VTEFYKSVHGALRLGRESPGVPKLPFRFWTSHSYDDCDGGKEPARNPNLVGASKRRRRRAGGIDRAQLQESAREVENGCTISIALRGNVTITSEVTARLDDGGQIDPGNVTPASG
jgi:hypothetical protein